MGTLLRREETTPRQRNPAVKDGQDNRYLRKDQTMNRKSPYPGARRYEDFRQKSVERFQNYSRYAKNHIIGRNGSLVDLLCHLSVLRNAGVTDRHAGMSARGARYQETRGAKAMQQQAAHCLPRQLLVNGRDPSSMMVSSVAQHELRRLFGKVTVAPRCLNTADSYSEQAANGLVAAFLQTCHGVINCARQGNAPVEKLFRHDGQRFGELYHQDVWPINREQIVTVLQQIWVPKALRAYESASEVIVRANREEINGDPSDDVLYVLEKYGQHHLMIPSRLRENVVSNIERDAGSIGDERALGVD